MIKTKVLYLVIFLFFLFFEVSLRVCVFWDGDLIRFLYPGRCWGTNEDIVELLVLNFFVHTLQPAGFRQLSRIVVFPPRVPGKRRRPGEGGHLGRAGHAGVGPGGRGAPASVRVSQHFALTRARPETCGERCSSAVRMGGL